MAQSIPDMAAELLHKRKQVQERIEKIRAAEGNWTTYQLAANEALECAYTGIRQAWAMLDRLQQLADEQIAAAEPGEA